MHSYRRLSSTVHIVSFEMEMSTLVINIGTHSDAKTSSSPLTPSKFSTYEHPHSIGLTPPPALLLYPITPRPRSSEVFLWRLWYEARCSSWTERSLRSLIFGQLEAAYLRKLFTQISIPQSRLRTCHGIRVHPEMVASWEGKLSTFTVGSLHGY